jgi:hypothetical protein
MKVVRVVITAFVIASLAATVVFAGPFGPRGGKGPGGSRGECTGFKRRGRLLRHSMPTAEQLTKAGATEEQVKALTQFEQEQQLKRIDLKANVERARLALDRSMESKSVDEGAVMKAADTLNQARGELFKLNVASRLQMRKILGDEILSKIREERPHRRHARRRHERRFRHRDASPLEEGPEHLEQ